MAGYSDMTKRPHSGPLESAAAIIGIGCRFPGGAGDPRAFMDLLRNQVDAISETPASRWKIEDYYDPQPKAGRTYTRWGGYLADIDRFDAGYFGMSPREAAAVDPQQRLLLECAVEALEDGGQRINRESGARTGVYVGLWSGDYEDLVFSDPAHIDFYRTQGTGRYTAAGRLSFMLGLEGPSLAVDTACSSSLVTVHLACQSLRDGDCDVALAGGVNLLLQPQVTIAYSQSRMMSPTGRCKFGDASGDGYVRAEGAGLVLLKPLARAIADKDPIYAIVRGSAINNDGHSSGSFGTPGVSGQEAMLRLAYKNAGVDPREVVYVEAHGTGTRRGDPVEVRALANVLCEGRSSDHPLWIGSVKTNVGHMEAAAGIGGLIKAAMTLHERAIPASLHFKTPNPNIPWNQLPLKIPGSLIELQEDSQVLYAGVNSFGISGTNAHIVLQEAPQTPATVARDEGAAPILLGLTATTPAALKDQAARFAEFLKTSTAPIQDIAYTAGARRAHHKERAAVGGYSRADLIQSLEAFVRNEETPGLASGEAFLPARTAPARKKKVVFVFSGQGSQWPAMAMDLYDSDPAFAAAFDAVDKEIKKAGGFSVLAEIKKDPAQSKLANINVMWPAIFAVQASLFDWLAKAEVSPDAVVGHSIGEAAAAYACGALTLKDAVAVIVWQARLVQETAGQGGMALIGLPREKTAAEIRPFADRLSVAIESSPEACVVSGEATAIDQLIEKLSAQDIFCRKVNTDAAVHSVQMEPLEQRLLQALGKTKARENSLPFYSAVRGRLLPGTELNSAYWRDNIRRPVEFASVIDAIANDGHELFVEFAPHPIVGVSIQECLRAHEMKGETFALLKRDENGPRKCGETLSALYQNGARVNLDALRSKTTLPPLLLKSGKPRIAFVFSGQGPQWWAMGRELLETVPLFRQKVEEIDRLLQKHAKWSVLEELQRSEAESRLSETRYAQPAIFALQTGLAELWKSWGVMPDAVTGHSVGEIAAAHASGALSLEQAVKVIYNRGQLMNEATGLGKMAAIEAPLERVREFLKGREHLVSIGASNSPLSTVLSGETRALETILEQVDAAGIQQKMLPVNYAFHSPQMEPFKERMNRAMKGLKAQPESTPIVSTVTGKLARGEDYGGAYWGDNIREGVSFAQAIDTLLENDITLFLEIGPHPVLQNYIQQCGEKRDMRALTVFSLRRQQPERATLMTNAAQLFVWNFQFDWDVFFPQARCTRLPAYAWRRERHWIETPRTGGARAVSSGADAHPLLSAVVDGAETTYRTAAAPRSAPALFGLTQHGIGVAPAGALLDAGLAVARQNAQRAGRSVELYDVRIPRPAATPTEGDLLIELVTSHDNDSEWSIRAYDAFGADGDELAWNRNFSGAIRPGPAAGPVEDLIRLKSSFSRELSGQEFYETLGQRNCALGDPLRTVIEFRRRDDAAYLQFGPATEGAWTVGVDRLENALAALALLTAGDAGSAAGFVKKIQTMTAFGGRGEAVAAHIQLTSKTASEGKGRITFFDEEGRAAVVCDGVEIALMDGPALLAAAHKSLQDWIYEREWRPVARGAAEPIADQRWLIFADQSGRAEAAAALMQTHGAIVALVRPGEAYSFAGGAEFTLAPHSAPDFDRLLTDAATDGPLSGALYLWGADAASVEDWRVDQRFVAGGLLHLSQALTRHLKTNAPRLLIATEGAQSVLAFSECDNFSRATLWGFGAVLDQEHPEFKCKRIDLDPNDSQTQSEAILAEIQANDRENRVAYRDGQRYGQRLVRAGSGEVKPPEVSTTKGEDPLQILDIGERGILDNLAWRPLTRSAPGPDDVEIQVRVAGLNFRDVLSAMDLYPGGPIPMGVECAGVVTAIGENVEDLEVGDSVLAISSRPTFANYVVTRADLAIKKPDAMSFEEAASIPVVFLTCYYAFEHLGRLRRGDRVLIHSAAGGVGLAAIQLARLAGAEIFATCSTDEKRDYLRSLGVQRIYDSRSLDFAGEVLRDTGGDGVDLVLNSLSGKAIPTSIGLLRKGGRYLEIGKKDILTAKEVAKIKKGISYFIIDLMEVVREKPDLIHSMLQHLIDDFGSGRLKPIPHVDFIAEKAADAFRYMARGKHIGKILLQLGARENGVAPRYVGIRSDASYLVTGGLGALGLVFAEWLANQGARTIVLTGRNAPSPDVNRTLQDLSARTGALFVPMQGDISRETDVVRILDEIDRTLPPLRGLIHSAGVLQDRTLEQQDWALFEDIFASKVGGAWLLHKHTRGRKLDLFVTFSSIAAVLGLSAQSNYSAANAFMDALVEHRRALGNSGLSIQWAPWAQIGMVTGITSELFRRGINALPTELGLRAFERALREQRVQAAVIHLHWSRYIERHSGAQTAAFLDEVSAASSSASQEGAATPANLLEELALAPQPQRQRMVYDHVVGQLAKILGANSNAAIDGQRGFKELGLDSLMTVELRNRLQNSLKTSLPSTLAFDYPTAKSLADFLMKQALKLPEVQPKAPLEVVVPHVKSDEPAARSPEVPANQQAAGAVFGANEGATAATAAAMATAAPESPPSVGAMMDALDELSDDAALAELLGQK